MKYREYHKGIVYFLIALLLFIFFGGFTFIAFLFQFTATLFIQMLPLLFVFYLVYVFYRSAARYYRIESHVRQSSPDHARFVELLVRILIGVMKIDRRMDDRALNVIRAFFRQNLQYNPVAMMWLEDLIRHSLDQSDSVEELCMEFNARFNYESKLILLQLVYRVVFANDFQTDAERDLIVRIVSLLGISEADHNRIRVFFQATDNADAYYKILGLSPGASKEEIRKAYRHAIKENHPDKVHHLGEEFVKVAEEKMQQINKAYDYLVKRSG